VVVKVLIKKKNARLMMEEKIRQAEKDTIKLVARRKRLFYGGGPDAV
jgi:hypothetical protein